MYEDLTVLVVDRDERCRAALVTALRRLGLRALGLMLADEAVGLLDGIDAEIALLRGVDAHDRAVEELRRRTPLVVVTGEESSTEETVVELLRALGRPEEAAHLN
jgi:FixJ family two-component response regulator